MQLLGHLALGYFSALIAGKYAKAKFLIPVAWFCSLLPDLDVFAFRYITHRGPTHSIILAAAIFIPIYVATRRFLPYFAAVASHTLIGDYFNPPEKLLWPINNNWYGAPANLSLTGTSLQTAELILFALMATVIIYQYLRKNSQKHATPINPQTNTTQ